MIREEWVVTGVESLRLASDSSLQLFQASDSSLQLLASDSSLHLTAACSCFKLWCSPSCRAFLPGWEPLEEVVREPGRSRTWTNVKLLTPFCRTSSPIPWLFLWDHGSFVSFCLLPLGFIFAKTRLNLGANFNACLCCLLSFYFNILLLCFLHVSLSLILPPIWHFWTHPGGRPTMAPASPPASPSFRSNTPYFMFSTGHTCWEGKFTFEGIWVVAGQCDLNYIGCF